MPSSEPIIMNKIVTGMLSTVPRPSPTALYVLSYNRGDLRVFTHSPGMADRLGSKYCFIVDASERHSGGQLQIPARGDVYFFQVHFEASWYVSDPLTIVRRNAVHGDELVTSFLSNHMWRLGRAHMPDDAQGAEDDILASLYTPWDMGNGLTLTGITARIVLDDRQSNAVAELDLDGQTGLLEQRRYARLRKRLADGDQSLILEHLAQHPDDTGSILQMLTSSRERNEQNRIAMFDRLAEKGFIDESDVGALRDAVLGGASALPAGVPAHPGPNAITPIAPSIPPPHHDTQGYSADSGGWRPGADAPPTHVPPPRALQYEDAAPTEEQTTAAAPQGGVSAWKPVGRGRPNRRRE